MHALPHDAAAAGVAQGVSAMHGGHPGAAAGYPHGNPAPPPNPTVGSQFLPGGREVAPFGRRVPGFIIDYMLAVGVSVALYVAYLILGFLAAAAGGEAGAGVFAGSLCFGPVLFTIALLGVGVYNRIYLIGKRGYSIGQGLMNLRLVDHTGAAPKMETAALRFLAQFVLMYVPFGMFVDLLFPLFDTEHGQTLHDKAVKTYVVLRT